MLDAHVDGYDAGRNSFMGFGLCIVHDPKSWIRCRLGIWELGREKTISTTGMRCELFSGSIAGLVLVHLEGLQTVSNGLESIARRVETYIATRDLYLERRLLGRPNISITGEVRA
jgi:hypothetical protein